MNQTKPAIDVYDQSTIDYLRGDGVMEGLLERVTHLAQEVADLRAERAELPQAVHEAYVDAQRAVAALNCTPVPASRDHVRGMMRMQEDAVRAIRKAAEAHRATSALAALAALKNHGANK